MKIAAKKEEQQIKIVKVILKKSLKLCKGRNLPKVFEKSGTDGVPTTTWGSTSRNESDIQYILLKLQCISEDY